VILLPNAGRGPLAPGHTSLSRFDSEEHYGQGSAPPADRVRQQTTRIPRVGWRQRRSGGLAGRHFVGDDGATLSDSSPSTTVRTILLAPEHRNFLVEVGRTMLPFSSMADLLGEEPYSVAAFSDYAGAAPAAKYDVFATYIVHWNSVGRLIEDLKRLRAKHGIPERLIDFKSRKDRMKEKVLRPWVERFALHPGLLFVLCVDKRLATTDDTLQSLREMKASIQAHGLPLTASTAAGLARKLSFLAVIGHLIEPRHRFVWVSDEDEILQGQVSAVTGDALGALAERVLKAPLAAFGYCSPKGMGKLREDWEILLSLPDIAAGTLATALPLPYAPSEIRDTELPTALFFRGLAAFSSPTESGGNPGRMLTVVLEKTEQGNVSAKYPRFELDRVDAHEIDHAKTQRGATNRPMLSEPTSSSELLPFASRKIGRNKPCRCGSGKKYKRCCMAKDQGRWT